MIGEAKQCFAVVTEEEILQMVTFFEGVVFLPSLYMYMLMQLFSSSPSAINQFDISEIHAHVGIKCKIHET